MPKIEWDKTFATYVTGKGLIFIMHNIYFLQIKKANKSIEKWTKYINRQFI